MTSTMFGVSQDRLLSGLRVLHRNACAYTRPDAPAAEARCDCKFGIQGAPNAVSELTGCPELRQMVAMVAAMTPTEYAMLAERAGVEGAGGVPKKRIVITCTLCGRTWDPEHAAGRCAGRKGGG